jgi:uncharacterized protein with NRDE domain
MCLIAFAWQVRSRWSLVLAANRDEFHARAATGAEWQSDAAQVYGGRDLEKQGSWLQFSTARRLAAVTNVRSGPTPPRAPRSRGELVASFVRDHATVPAWLERRAPELEAYGAFNLLLWDGQGLAVASNATGIAWQRVEPGIHGLANGPFDAPWPKVRRARAALARWVADDPANGEPDFLALFALLSDEQVPPDDQLPDTGVGLALERSLAPPFIRGDRYGTRCSSVVLVGHDVAWFAERRFGPNGASLGTHVERIGLGRS